MTDLWTVLTEHLEDRFDELEPCERCQLDKDEKCLDRGLGWAPDTRLALHDITCGCGCWTRAAYRSQVYRDLTATRERTFKRLDQFRPCVGCVAKQHHCEWVDGETGEYVWYPCGCVRPGHSKDDCVDSRTGDSLLADDDLTRGCGCAIGPSLHEHLGLTASPDAIRQGFEERQPSLDRCDQCDYADHQGCVDVDLEPVEVAQSSVCSCGCAPRTILTRWEQTLAGR